MPSYKFHLEKFHVTLLGFLTATTYFYIFIFLFLGIKEMLPVLLPSVIIFSFCVLLSIRKNFDVASGLFLITAFILVSMSSFMLGSASGAHVFFIPIIGLSAMILNRRGIMYYSFVMGGAVMLFLIESSADKYGWLLIKPADSHFISTLNIITSLVFVFVSLHFLLIQKDATEQKLNNLHDNLLAFMDSKKEMFFLLNPEYKIIVANKASREQINQIFLTDEKEGTAEGASFLELIHRFSEIDSPEAFIEDFQKAYSGIPVQREVMRKQGNTNFWSHLEYLPALNPENKITAVSLSISDITEQKMRELEMQDAKTRAESLTRQKSVFISGVSHEIRTPMNAIIGLTDLLLEDELPQKAHNYLSKIHTASQNLLVILDDVLDYSKIEAGKFQLNTTDYELKSVVENCIGIYRPKAEAKDLKLELTYDPTLPGKVHGDPVRLGQVLNNLLSNAVKFTEKGFVKVTVSSYGTSGNACNVRFSVADTGIGIPTGQLRKIFDSFYQVEELGKYRKPGGTGLGLSIAKSLVELQGGEIVVESKLDIGTQFDFVVPLDAASTQADPAPLKRINTTDQHLLKGIKVLVAEDNPANSLLLVGLLKKWEVEAHVAENGLQALYLMSVHQYDAVLMDIEMPEMDGLEAVKRIRANEMKGVRTNIPIIGLSANVLDEMLQDALRAGMNLYIPKPFNKDELYSALVSLVVKEEKTTIQMSKAAETTHAGKHTGADSSRNLDINFLTERVSNDTELVQHVLKLFKETYKEEINSLFKLLEDQNMPALRRLAHKLRSGFYNVGMTGTAKNMQLIEDLADDTPDNSKIMELSLTVREDFMMAEREIDSYLQAAG